MSRFQRMPPIKMRHGVSLGLSAKKSAIACSLAKFLLEDRLAFPFPATFVNLFRSPMASQTAASYEGELEGRKKLLLVVTERDIVFSCPACQGELVVDRDGAGLEVPCSHCGHVLTVPAHQPRVTADQPAVALVANRTAEPTSPEMPSRTFDFAAFTPEQLGRRLNELKHQLKENRSQDTEMRGHVNRATMELHRLQLRLKTLQERHMDIEAELAALQRQVESPGAA